MVLLIFGQPLALAEGVLTVSAGRYHTCAVTVGSAAMCWGYNYYGQTGQDTGTTNLAAVVPGLTEGVSDIGIGGNHTCALLKDGTVKCWGDNSFGQLGNGTTTGGKTPVVVAGLNGVVQLSVGNDNNCALLATGTVVCWGRNNYSQIGDGTTVNRTLPVAVLGVNNIAMIATGGNFACALTKAGTVQCWGANYAGQLGNGVVSNTNSLRVDVLGLSDISMIGTGNAHACALGNNGAVKCWGENYYGSVINSTALNVSIPVAIPELSSGIRFLHSRDRQNCTIAVSGAVNCWGHVVDYALGRTRSGFYALGYTLNGVPSMISIGQSSGCALIGTGLQCWGGNNRYGLLGAGSYVDNIPFAVDVVGLTGGIPPVPVTLAPSTDDHPVYIWHAAPGAKYYQLLIDQTPHFYTDVEAGCPGGVGLCRITGAILPAGSHSWRVQSGNNNGAGAWSAERTFISR